MYRNYISRSDGKTCRGQLGAGKLKAIVWTALLVFLAYAAFKIMPIYIAEYQLADKIQEEARFAIVNHYSEEQIRDAVYKAVQELDIPVAREQIKVLSSATGANFAGLHRSRRSHRLPRGPALYAFRPESLPYLRSALHGFSHFTSEFCGPCGEWA